MDAHINFCYLKFLPITKKEIKVGRYRWVFNHLALSEEVDIQRTDKALSANLIQAFDAELARYIIININECFTIHDSFGVDISRVHSLMDATNHFFAFTAFKKKVDTDYGLFILI